MLLMEVVSAKVCAGRSGFSRVCCGVYREGGSEERNRERKFTSQKNVNRFRQMRQCLR